MQTETTDSAGEELARIDAVARALAREFGPAPQTAVVLGSGQGEALAGAVEQACAPWSALGLMSAGVVGHKGEAALLTLGGRPLLVMRGRLHPYEGHGLPASVRGVRALARWGVRRLVLTSAVGAVDASLAPGQLVLVEDHLNLSGYSPLAGPNLAALGPRFPDLTHLYTPHLRAALRARAAAEGWPALAEGVYAMMAGPSYETPAEIRMLQRLGAAVVGMSLVPEAVAAGHAGLEVLGVAVVANLAAGLSPTPLTHAEVMEAVGLASGRVRQLLEAVVEVE